MRRHVTIAKDGRINPATTRNANAVTSEGEERMASAATHDVCVGG
jgi:hypothetical protein